MIQLRQLKECRIMKEQVKLKQLLYCLDSNLKLRLRYFTPSKHIERTIASGTRDEMPFKFLDSIVVGVEEAPPDSYYDKLITVEKPYKKPFIVRRKHTSKCWMRLHHRGVDC